MVIKLNFANAILAPLRTQQVAGVGLLAIAAVLVANRAFSALPSPDILSMALLAIAAITALAVSRTEQGFTSLIGLFFLTTVVFNLGRPILWLIFRDDSVYDLTFGLTLSSGSTEKSELLLFWCIGIAAFAGGYFAFYRVTKPRQPTLSARWTAYCRRSFWITFVISAISIPLLAASKLATFISQGYAGLYASQTTYSFSWLRALDFLLPALFSLAVLLRESRYMRLVAVAVTAYTLAGLIVGQRAAVGRWILVAVWYLSVIRQKRVRRWLLASAGAVLIILFQLVAGWRLGFDSSTTLAQFMVDQGITFVLPGAIRELPPPPFHTILGSVIPLGGLYSVLSVGTATDRMLGNYLSSNFNITAFEEGYGLGGTFYLEPFYACGRVWIFYLLACLLLGVLLRKWEESSSRHNLPLFYLCMCISDIVFLPRGTIAAITSQVIYASTYMLAIYLFDRVAVNCSSSVRPVSSVHQETTAHA